MQPKYLIIAGDFSEISGGAYALHLLCDHLNGIGEEAYICPFVTSQEIRPTTTFGGVGSAAKAWLNWHLRQKRAVLRTSPDLQTPTLSDTSVVRRDPSWVVIYPEIVFGNPLLARNVVRWLLHHPGHLSGSFSFARDELHIRYSDWVAPIHSPIFHIADIRLVVSALPKCYSSGLPDQERSGTAYCVRKGRDRDLVRPADDWILIDELPHERVAEIFKRVKTFISYDLCTAYSEFAAICGADSVVIPEPGVTEEQWHANESERWGIAYGYDRLPWARQTVPLLLERLLQTEQNSRRNVLEFSNLCRRVFKFSPRTGPDVTLLPN